MNLLNPVESSVCCQRKNRISRVRILFLSCLLLISFSIIADAAPVLVLPGYDKPVSFEKKPLLLLQIGDNMDYIRPDYDDSDWNIVSLPFNWNTIFPGYTGICWYRLYVKFPDKKPARSPGIEFGTITDADEFYFNGHLIARTGSIGPPRVSAYDKKRIYEIPSSLIKYGETNVIAVRIAGLFSNANGPYRGNFSIGYFQKLQSDSIAGEFFNVLFIVIYIAVSFYFGLFFVRYPVEKEYLFFSLFTLSTALYLFLRTQVRFFITDDFYILKKTEYLILIVILPLFTEFITYLFKIERKIYQKFFYVVSLANFIAVLLISDYTLWYAILVYSIEPSWLIPIGMFFILLIKEFRQNRESRLILAALGVLLITAVNDSMLIWAVYNFIPLTNYGFMVFIISFSVLMHNRFINLQKAYENLTNKDSGKNEISDQTRRKIDQAMRIIRSTYTTPVTREDVAETIEMNPDHLGKIFKKCTGKKISDYINELRIEEAARQLVETDKSIIEIAFAVGFESMSTFYRLFQKSIGESPINYRDKNKK